jgi:hypothetical protein
VAHSLQFQAEGFDPRCVILCYLKSPVDDHTVAQSRGAKLQRCYLKAFEQGKNPCLHPAEVVHLHREVISHGWLQKQKATLRWSEGWLGT